MDYEAFKASIKECVGKKVEKGGKVVINHVLKNNGMELDGLVIMEKECNVAPTIYINGFYEQLCSGRELEDIVEELFKIYENNKSNFKFNPELFNEYSNIKQSVVYKVINYDKNRKLLRDVPHKKILDLAVVYYCLIGQNNGINATALIHNEHINVWKISQNELHSDAVKNTPHLLRSCIRPMSGVLSDMAQELEMEDDIAKEITAMNLARIENEMYVLTNSSRINGAACILYDEVLQQFAETLDDDLYILPSSIHEVIILPKACDYDRDTLVSMVREVNADGVAQDEILSDNVYEYNRKQKVITL